ncbi:MAG: hypothetical protein Q8R37_03225 [Nanoarchaeota archaeon]|nr:hypothetical protein [Nanoarchaeota archaeon]
MKEIKLDTKLAQLVDEAGKMYTGELIARLEYHAEEHYNAAAAEHGVLSLLFDDMSLKCANAYYIVEKEISEKKQEIKFGPFQAFLSVILYRNDPKAKIKIAAPTKVRFDENLESLVDEEGVKYEGKRFKTISANSYSHSTSQEATAVAVQKLVHTIEDINSKEYESNAYGPVTAYEIIGSHCSDTRQEYDTTPFTATVTAILYK